MSKFNVGDRVKANKKSNDLYRYTTLENEFEGIVIDAEIELPKTEMILEIKLEEKKEMKILEIYEERQMKNLQKQCNEEKIRILKADKIQAIVLETKEKISEILRTDDVCAKIDCTSDLIEEDTKKALENLEIEYNKKVSKLLETIKEVEAQLDLSETYETKIDILKRYKILDEEGKITEFKEPLVERYCCDVNAVIVDKEVKVDNEGKVKKTRKAFGRK